MIPRSATFMGSLSGSFADGLPVAVAAVNRLVVRQNAEELETVLFDLGTDAVVQLSVRRAVDDQTHLSGFKPISSIISAILATA